MIEIHQGETGMQTTIQMWLNPVNLGILFLCLCAGVWILAHSAPNDRSK